MSERWSALLQELGQLSNIVTSGLMCGLQHRISRDGSASTQEKCRRLIFTHLVQRDAPGNRLCHTGTSREQHLSPSLWDEGLDLFHLLDVIEDEQPVDVRMEPAFDGLNDASLLRFVFFWQVE